MKKAKTSKSLGPAKSIRGAPTVERYLSAVPEAARNNFEKLRAAVLSVVPAEASETISYGIPAVRYGNIVVWYAAFAKHCSLFPTAAVIDIFNNELRAYTTSKGTIQFPIDKPLPVGLIKKIVKVRLTQLTKQKTE